MIKQRSRRELLKAGIEQMEVSFKHLRTPRIDLIAAHNLQDTQPPLRTLRQWKQAGRIRYVGITTSFERQYPEFEQTMKDGGAPNRTGRGGRR